MDAFKEANLDPADNLLDGLTKIAKVEKCREVLLSLLYPDTKALLEVNQKLGTIAKALKEQTVKRDKTVSLLMEKQKHKDTVHAKYLEVLAAQQNTSARVLELAKSKSRECKRLLMQLDEMKAGSVQPSLAIECLDVQVETELTSQDAFIKVDQIGEDVGVQVDLISIVVVNESIETEIISDDVQSIECETDAVDDKVTTVDSGPQDREDSMQAQVTKLVTMLKIAHQTLKESQQNHQSDLCALKASYASKIEDLTTTIHEMEASNADFKVSENSRNDVMSAECETDSVKRESKSVECDSISLSNDHVETEEMIGMNDDDKQLEARLMTSIHMLKMAQEALKASHHNYQSDLCAMKTSYTSKIEELQSACNKSEQLKTELEKRFQLSVCMLQQSHNHLSGLNDQLMELSSEKIGLVKDLNTAGETNSRLIADKLELEEQNKFHGVKLENALGKLTLLLKSFSQFKDASMADHAKLITLVNEQSTALSRAQNFIQRSHDTLTKSHESEKSLCLMISRLESRLKETEQTNVTLNQEKEALEAELKLNSTVRQQALMEKNQMLRLKLETSVKHLAAIFSITKSQVAANQQSRIALSASNETVADYQEMLKRTLTELHLLALTYDGFIQDYKAAVAKEFQKIEAKHRAELNTSNNEAKQLKAKLVASSMQMKQSLLLSINLYKMVTFVSVESERGKLNAKSTIKILKRNLEKVKTSSYSALELLPEYTETIESLQNLLAENNSNLQSLKQTLMSCKARINTQNALLDVERKENARLRHDLQTERCKSNLMYIGEMERRLVLTQGQLSEANDQNVKLLELLQIKLAQDMHAKVTKRQAEREVFLLRELFSM